MTHVSDFTKSNNQIVLDLINAHTVPGTPELTSAQVDLALLTEDGAKATSLRLTSKTGSGYRGTADVAYNRVALNEVPQIEANVHETEENTISGILNEVNIRYGINLTAEDVTINGQTLEAIGELPINPTNHDDVVLVINAKSSSMVWVGGIDLSYKPLVVELRHAVGITMLDGLYAPLTLPNPDEDEWAGGIQFKTYSPADAASGTMVGGGLASGSSKNWMAYIRKQNAGGVLKHVLAFSERIDGVWTETGIIGISTVLDGTGAYEVIDYVLGANEDGTRFVVCCNVNNSPRLLVYARNPGNSILTFLHSLGPDAGVFEPNRPVYFSFDEQNRVIFISFDGWLMYTGMDGPDGLGGQYSMYTDNSSRGNYPFYLGNGRTGVFVGVDGFTVLTFVNGNLSYVNAEGVVTEVTNWYYGLPTHIIDYGDFRSTIMDAVSNGGMVHGATGNATHAMLLLRHPERLVANAFVFQYNGSTVEFIGTTPDYPTVLGSGEEFYSSFALSSSNDTIAVAAGDVETGLRVDAYTIADPLNPDSPAPTFRKLVPDLYVSPLSNDANIVSFRPSIRINGEEILVGDQNSFMKFDREDALTIGAQNEAVREQMANAGCVEIFTYVS